MSIFGDIWNGIKGVASADAQGIGKAISYGSRNIGAQTTNAQTTPQLPTVASSNSAFMASNPQYATAGGTGPGSPEAAAAQQSLDLQKYFPGYNQNTPVTPVNFNIDPNGTINSSSMNPTTTVSDALAARNAAAAGMVGGQSGYSSSVPSTDFLKSLYSNYQASANDYTNSAAAMNQQRLAELHAVESAYTQSGGLTSGRDSAINDINQRYGNTLSTLETTNQAAAANMDAYSRFYSTFMKPQEVSPGGTLVTPTGQPVYQGNGAAPATVMQTAQQLAQMAMQSGTMQYNPDGTPNLQPYLEQAQSYYQTHQVLGSNAGGMNPAQQQGVSGSYPSGNVTQDTYQYGISQGLPPTLAGAVTLSPNTGDYYISGTKTGGVPDQAVTSQSGRSGIAYVPSANVPNIQQLDTAIGQMQNVHALAQQYLTPGLLGRLKGLTTNKLQTFFQTDPGWANFNQVRLQAIDYLKGLAQGGGFRTTQSEIDTAANSLIDISDNLESANAKMGTAMTNINNAFREYLPTHKNVVLGQGPASGGGSSSSNPFSASSFYGN